MKTIARNILKAPASINGLTNGVCAASGVGYTCTNVVGAGSYNWTVPTGATIMSGQGSTSIVVDFAGSFTAGVISVNAVNGCGGGASRSLSVKAAPGQPGPISGPSAPCTNSINTYEVAAMPGASVYTWTVPASFTIQSGQGTKTIQVLTPSSTVTNRTISVRASNNCGTGATRSLSGINVVNCVRATEATALIQDIYPNPARTLVHLVLHPAEAMPTNIEILDLSGRSLMSQSAELQPGENVIALNIEMLPQGIYLLQVTTPEGTSVMKLIKE